MDAASPIRLDEARRFLAPLERADRVLLAVSGGPDSTALMRLAAEVASADAWPPMAVASVDHQLQSGSADVAAEVVDQARSLGLEAHTLLWRGDKPRTGLQDAAREARYALLLGLAARIGATHLVTAHTLDDQAETILFRMARGSGPAGLVGMRSAIERGGLMHLRPFLAVAKHRLIATSRQRGWPFVEDAANHDERFARTRLRVLMPRLAEEGLDAQMLATLALRLARSEAAIVDAARVLRLRAAQSCGPELVVLNSSLMVNEPGAVVTAMLNVALTDFCHAGPPRLRRLENLVEDLDQALRTGRTLSRTLHGALITLSATGRLELRREAPRRRGLAPKRDRVTGPFG